MEVCILVVWIAIQDQPATNYCFTSARARHDWTSSMQHDAKLRQYEWIGVEMDKPNKRYKIIYPET